MTTLVSIIDEGCIWMGADTAVTDETVVMKAENHKVSRHGNFLLGFVGSVSIGTLLGTRKFDDIPSENTIAHFYDSFIPFCKKQVKKAGCDPKEYAVTQLLVAHETGVYEIVLDPPIVIKHTETAAGSGANFALGSLHSSKRLNAEDRIVEALVAATKYDPFTDGPYVLEVMDYE